MLHGRAGCPARRNAGRNGAGTVTATPTQREPFERLSIFFPMWNEQEYIHRAVGAARTICVELVDAEQILDYEIIIIDDASTDATPELADAMAAADPHVRVVHHAQNRKLGGSLKSGFAAATGDVVLYTDADLPFEMTELVRALRVLETYEVDVVSAYRLDRTGEGPRRAVYSFFYNWLIQLAFGTRLRDINFAFKLCRRRVLDHVTLKSEGSFIDAELVIRAQRSGFQVLQIGVDYFPRTRGVSTLSSFGVIKKMLMEMVRLRSELKDVVPVAGPASGPA
jgi:glycosyltransferase involved in cell wall biosynthesis